MHINITMVLFLFLAVIILFGAHYLIYSSIARFFGLGLLAKKILAAILGFLMISFVLSSLLAHYWQDNYFARIFYGFSGFWIGWMVNILLAVAAAWAVIWVLRIFGVNIGKAIIGGSFLGLSLAVAIYGVWNAFHPVVKNISVKINNLPAAWQGKKIVMISDVHLGQIYRADFAQKIAREINAQQPDLILIDGDLFDGIDGEALDVFVAPLGELKAPRGIYFVTGNHETYLGVDKAEAVLARAGIRVLNDEIKTVEGLQIIGVSYPTANLFSKDVAGAIRRAGYTAGLPSVLMYHAPTNIAEIKNLGVDLQLAGHTHDGQLWPINYIVRLIYRGHEYGLRQEGNYNEYTSSGLGGWGPPMRTAARGEVVVIKLMSNFQ